MLGMGAMYGVLLIQVPLDDARFLIPPCSPFVYEQADAFMRVFSIHNVAMFLDNVFYL